MAISGHGMRGTVWGDTGALPTAQAYEIPGGTLAPFSAGRLKYLLVTTCGNCADFAAPLWLDALRREMPVHGILGYTGTYTGDATGALTMKKFGEAMQKNPNFTVLQCWERANRGLPWGAVVLDAAAKAGLLQVSPGTGLVFKLRDANPFKDGGPNGRVDGIRVTMPPGGVSQVDLAFVVNATAAKAFPAIADGTHGLFFTEIMPMPGRSAGRTMTLSEGVYLV